jgi:hypothetical protein
MKKTALSGLMMLVAGSLLAADASPKDDVTGAAKKLAAKNNYSWKTTVTMPEGGGGGGGGGGGRFRPGPTEGKTEKDGYTLLVMTRGENKTEAVLKGGKGAFKSPDGDWKSLAEAAADDGGGGQFSPARFIARMLQGYKAPAADAEDLAGKVKDLKMSDGVYSGDLTEEGAKQAVMGRGFGGGGNGPEISGAKGSVKFWVKDGLLSKYETHVEGTISFNGNDRDINRTTTVEIKDVGETKVTVPEEAAKKLS